MFRHVYPYQVPRDELLFITPEPRKKLFLNMIENYKVFCPTMKLEYAYLNTDSKYPVDYLIIFSATSTDGKPIFLWKCPYLYTWDSIPGYRYAVRNNLIPQFFNEESHNMCIISRSRFKEFLAEMCHIPWSDWKNSTHAIELMNKMSDLSLRYTPKKK